MSASFNLHSANSNSVVVRNFEGDKHSVGQFATVTVQDIEKNAEVSLYFANLGEVLNFSLMIQQEMKKALEDKN